MFLVAGVNMPVISCVLDASGQTPYISVSLYLDMCILGEQAAKEPPPALAQTGGVPPGAMGLQMDMDLMDTFLRLAKLLEAPDEIPVMGDILLRETHYRLLRSPAGAILRGYNIIGSQGNRILEAINWLRKNFRQPLLVETLAEKAHMAPSTFHKYFKDVTTLTPLQYQKRLRLDEAQRLMFSEGHDVMRAAGEVGYESITQFIYTLAPLWFKTSPFRPIERHPALKSGVFLAR